MSDEVEQHILDKYDLVQKLGKGAYGIVWKAMDKKYKKIVALKKVFDAFHNVTDSQRTYREVMFLVELRGHENIISLRNVINAQNNKDLYLVFDYMETDLHHVIRANILQEIHKQYIIYQLLKALKFMHSAELIHRDLKPANILIDSDCNIKVADFGLARSIACQTDDTNFKLTDYVATRWYRAPEILLGSTTYSKAVDMWSVGCILGELIVGKPIFPGSSTLNQIERVLELTGKPSQDDIDSIKSQHVQSVLSSINIPKKKSFSNFFSGSSDSALDLLQKLLVFNPSKRLTVEEALKHEYVKQFSCPEEELTRAVISIPMDDNTRFTIKEYRDQIYKFIVETRKGPSGITRSTTNSTPIPDTVSEKSEKIKPSSNTTSTTSSSTKTSTKTETVSTQPSSTNSLPTQSKNTTAYPSVNPSKPSTSTYTVK